MGLLDIDTDTLMGVSKDELVRLAKDIAKLEITSTRIGPQTPDELHQFIKDKYGVHIPRVAVTPGHDAPFDFICDAFFQRETSQLVVANREGAKSYSVALLHALFARFYPGYEGITAGAIEIQARRVYSAFKQVNSRFGKDQIEDSLQSETTYRNGSRVEIITMTYSSMNGPHCHPPDEPVLTSQGYVKISELDPHKHLLASYTTTNDRLTWGRIHGKIQKGATSEFVGVHKNRWGQWVAQAPSGRSNRLNLGTFSTELEAIQAVEAWRRDNPKIVHPFEVSEWDFDGELIVAESATGKSRMTPRHKVRVRMAREFKTSWVVYLMRKGDWWRIGMTTGGRLRLRLNEEEGDAAWIIGCYNNKLDAIRDEAFYQAYYGITGVCFAGNGSNSRVADQTLVHTALESCSETRAHYLLADKGMTPDLPLFMRNGNTGKGRHKYTSAGWFVTAIGNLVPVSGMFYMPSTTPTFERSLANGHPVSELVNLYRERYNGPVYSIDIRPHHYYVANGLVVHNSNLLHRDEFELAGKDRRPAFEEGDNITKSGQMRDGRIFKAHDILTSTRKLAKGLVQEMLDRVEADIRAGHRPSYRVYKWGVAETVSRVDNCRYYADPATPEEDLCPCNRYVNGFMPNGEDRTLQHICRGRFARSDGWRPLEPDIAGKFMKNSPGMWEAQQECTKPASEGLIVPNFDRDIHCIREFDPDPEYGRIFNSSDAGGTNAFASNWYMLLRRMVLAKGHNGNPIFIPAGSIVVFDEVYRADIGNNEFFKNIVAHEVAWKLAHEFFEVEERYMDIAAKAVRTDMREYDPPLPTTWRITREVEEHIKLVVEWIDKRRIFFAIDRCPMIVEELEAWQRDPDTGRPIDTFNHAISDLRYGLANIVRKLQIEAKHSGSKDAFASSNVVVPESQNYTRIPTSGPVGR